MFHYTSQSKRVERPGYPVGLKGNWVIPTNCGIVISFTGNIKRSPKLIINAHIAYGPRMGIAGKGYRVVVNTLPVLTLNIEEQRRLAPETKPVQRRIWVCNIDLNSPHSWGRLVYLEREQTQYCGQVRTNLSGITIFLIKRANTS